jgi:hypothetical protein
MRDFLNELHFIHSKQFSISQLDTFFSRKSMHSSLDSMLVNYVSIAELLRFIGYFILSFDQLFFITDLISFLFR